MRAKEFLPEYRQAYLEYIKSWFPDWPDYVIRDMLYPAAKGLGQEEFESWAQGIHEDYPVEAWRLERLPITLDIFTPKTQEQIRKREGGSKNPNQVPRDAERHATQAAMLQKQGISGEPIIVMKKPDGYDLVEGWHRTIQNLQAHPAGYTGPAWVGYL
jgi:hypothetical protein